MVPVCSTCFNIHYLYTLPAEYIYVFPIIFSIYFDYILSINLLILAMKVGVLCFLWIKNWTFKYLDELCASKG
jgi:hypothetical protein